MDIERIEVDGRTALRLTLTSEELDTGDAERVIDLREGWLPTGQSTIHVHIERGQHSD